MSDRSDGASQCTDSAAHSDPKPDRQQPIGIVVDTQTSNFRFDLTLIITGL